jgi:hypothetical protein
LDNDDLFPAAGFCMSSDTRRANLSPQRPFIAVSGFASYTLDKNAAE